MKPFTIEKPDNPCAICGSTSFYYKTNRCRKCAQELALKSKQEREMKVQMDRMVNAPNSRLEKELMKGVCYD